VELKLIGLEDQDLIQMMNNKAKIAIGEIFILVMGIFAFGFIVGGIERVRGEEKSGISSLTNSVYGITNTREKTIGDLEWAWNQASREGNHPKMNEIAKKIEDLKSKGTGDRTFLGLEGGGFADVIISSAAWALSAYGVVTLIGGLLGLEDSQTQSIGQAAAAGFGVGRFAYGYSDQNLLYTRDIADFLFGIKTPKGYGIAMGLIAAAIVFYLTYSDVETEQIEVVCEPWEAPTGGNDCDKCNIQGILPCSEYQCRSLGQACELVNEGTSEEKCVWVNPRDVDFPTIQPWDEALSEDYEYTPDGTINPPDNGVKIKKTTGESECIKAFTPLSFGIETNEPAKCKIDYLKKDSFDEMEFWFGGSQLFRTNHTQILSLPGKAAYESENIEVQNDGEYELSVRCQDKNGNPNTANFVFKFCIEEGPDTTAPVVVATSLINGRPILYDQSESDLVVYINEPAECRWDIEDVEYDLAENSMDCATSLTEMNAQMVYACRTTLTGLKSNSENKFYFRCKDQPNAEEGNRNTNTEAYEFVLRGTIPLEITEVGPNETVKDSTDPVKVTLTAETFAGAEEGKATCFFKEESQDENRYVEFRNTDSHQHSTDLLLEEGNYEYNIKCVDLGGNSDEKSVEFNVESDSEAPTVVRAFKEENNLKLITNEEAECVYSITDCSYLFGDGTAFTTLNKVNHFTEWDSSKNFYVKCKDKYGKEPSGCSIIVKPFEIYSGE
jgi:hypothetical protein